MTVTSSPANTPQQVDIRVTNSNGQSAVTPADKFTYTDGGYTMDAYGAVHPWAASVAPPGRTDGPSWTFKIARAEALRPDRGSGYVLDGYGGVHRFGGAPAATGVTGYWSGWDIARDIVLDPCDSTHTSGYVLDGWGGIHPFGDHAPAGTGEDYLPG